MKFDNFPFNGTYPWTMWAPSGNYVDNPTRPIQRCFIRKREMWGGWYSHYRAVARKRAISKAWLDAVNEKLREMPMEEISHVFDRQITGHSR